LNAPLAGAAGCAFFIYLPLNSALAVFFLSVSALFIFCRKYLREFFLLLLFFTAGACCACLSASLSSGFYCGLPEETVKKIKVHVYRDSSAAADGSSIHFVQLEKVYSTVSSAGAGGRALVFDKSSAVLYKGQTAVLEVKSFSRAEKFFKVQAKNIQYSDFNSAAGLYRKDFLQKSSGYFKSGPAGDLSLALLFGIKNGLDPSVKNNFYKAGLSHVLALSGFHIGLAAVLVLFPLRLVFGSKTASVLTAVLLAAYVYIAGAQAPAVRAWLFYLFFMLSRLLYRKCRPVSVLALTFLAECILLPDDTAQAGFILSYTSLAGIFLFSTPVKLQFLSFLPDKAASLFSAGLCAWFFSLPVSIVFFKIIIPAGLISSFFIIPLVSVYIILSFLYLVFSLLNFTLPVEWIYKLVYFLIEKGTEIFSAGPLIAAENPVINSIIIISLEAAFIIYLSFLINRERKVYAQL
jgi:ComEC/Rec2-related protein